MAQHASPNCAENTLLRRAHLTTSSSVPVRKLCWRPASPAVSPCVSTSFALTSAPPCGRRRHDQGALLVRCARPRSSSRRRHLPGAGAVGGLPGRAAALQPHPPDGG